MELNDYEKFGSSPAVEVSNKALSAKTPGTEGLIPENLDPIILANRIELRRDGDDVIERLLFQYDDGEIKVLRETRIPYEKWRQEYAPGIRGEFKDGDSMSGRI